MSFDFKNSLKRQAARLRMSQGQSGLSSQGNVARCAGSKLQKDREAGVSHFRVRLVDHDVDEFARNNDDFSHGPPFKMPPDFRVGQRR
jgi:hypothetical protein